VNGSNGYLMQLKLTLQCLLMTQKAYSLDIITSDQYHRLMTMLELTLNSMIGATKNEMSKM